MTVQRFRALMGVTFTLNVARNAVTQLRDAGVLDPGINDALRQAALDEQSAAAAAWGGQAIGTATYVAILVTLLAFIVGFVGMAVMRRWGRSLALCATVASFFFYLPYGPVVQPALDHLMDAVCMTLWSACLALAYYSPVASEFR